MGREESAPLLILTEGFLTYGGLAGRDLEALAIGIDEILDEDYLQYRIASTAYVGNHLAAAGVPLLKPFGGHAIYLDGRRFCDHLPDEQLPGWSLSVALYEHVGVRACEIGNVMFGRRTRATGALDVARPRPRPPGDPPPGLHPEPHGLRGRGDRRAAPRASEIRGLRFVHRPAVLPHFTATFEQV